MILIYPYFKRKNTINILISHLPISVNVFNGTEKRYSGIVTIKHINPTKDVKTNISDRINLNTFIFTPPNLTT